MAHPIPTSAAPRPSAPGPSRPEPAAPAALPDNRRQYERAELGGHLEIQLVGQATWFNVYARDISSGGFGFVTEVKLDPGEYICVGLRDPAEPTPIEAVVRHVEAQGRMYAVGVEFTNPLSDEQLDRIHHS